MSSLTPEERKMRLAGCTWAHSCMDAIDAAEHEAKRLSVALDATVQRAEKAEEKLRIQVIMHQADLDVRLKIEREIVEARAEIELLMQERAELGKQMIREGEAEVHAERLAHELEGWIEDRYGDLWREDEHCHSEALRMWEEGKA